MKIIRTGLFAILLALTAPAFAVTSISFTIPDAKATRVDRARLKINADTCASVSLPKTCTQVQARAINSALNVYSDVNDFVDRFMFANYYNPMLDIANAADQADAKAAWNLLNATQKNTVCNSFSPPLGNGCNLYP